MYQWLDRAPLGRNEHVVAGASIAILRAHKLEVVIGWNDIDLLLILPGVRFIFRLKDFVEHARADQIGPLMRRHCRLQLIGTTKYRLHVHRGVGLEPEIGRVKFS